MTGTVPISGRPSAGPAHRVARVMDAHRCGGGERRGAASLVARRRTRRHRRVRWESARPRISWMSRCASSAVEIGMSAPLAVPDGSSAVSRGTTAGARRASRRAAPIRPSSSIGARVAWVKRGSSHTVRSQVWLSPNARWRRGERCSLAPSSARRAHGPSRRRTRCDATGTCQGGTSRLGVGDRAFSRTSSTLARRARRRRP